MTKTICLAGAFALLLATLPSRDAHAFKFSIKKTSRNQPTTAAPVGNLPPSQVCNASSSIGLCYAFTGPQNTVDNTRKGNEMACKFMKGRYLASNTCPPVHALGKCTIKGGTPQEYMMFYYSGKRFTPANAEQDCRNPRSSIHTQGAGAWSPLR